MLEFVDVVAASAAGCFAWTGLQWLGSVVMSSLRRYVGGGLSTDAVVFDTAGNPFPNESLLTHRVAVPVEHVEVAANRLSDVGFVAMSVRVRDGLELGEAEYDTVMGHVETAASRLVDSLQRCAECSRWGGDHAGDCVAVREHVDMGVESMTCEHKEDARYGSG